METPIAFGTDGWRATLDEFTSERVWQVAQAVATYLIDHGLTGAPVGIAYDARQHSPGFSKDLSSVLRDNGIDVLRPPRDITTPVLAWAIANQRLAGGLMVTASHNPPEYNGVKFITAAGAPALPVVTDALEERLADPTTVAASGNEAPLLCLSGYIEHLHGLVDLDGISDLSIVYDAMHGSGRGVTDRVLVESGAAVNMYRCTRDPSFGGHAPEPKPDTLTTLADAVVKTQADLGIANDGDADRIAVITPDRGYLDENLLFAALYDYLLENDTGPAIRTVSTTHLIDRIAAAHDEPVIETPVGFKWIAAAMRAHDALIGGEESGGFSIRGHVREKDGVLLAMLIAAMTAAEPIDRRIDRILETYGQIVQDKIGIPCPEARKRSLLSDLGELLPETLAGVEVTSVSTVDGYKISLDDGSWVLVRPSGTEPTLRVYAEAASEARVSAILDATRTIVEPVV